MAYRILMTWVYSKTRSLLLAQWMHASYTGWLATLSPAVTFQQGLVWQAIFAVCWWAIIAVTRSRWRERAIREVDKTRKGRSPFRVLRALRA